MEGKGRRVMERKEEYSDGGRGGYYRFSRPRCRRRRVMEKEEVKSDEEG